jgi:hypothetical protein
VAEKPDPGFEDTFKLLDILQKLRVVCRQLGTEAMFKEGIEVTADDQVSIIRACELLEGKTLPFEGTRFTLTLGDEATDARTAAAVWQLDCGSANGQHFGERKFRGIRRRLNSSHRRHQSVQNCVAEREQAQN